MLTRSRELLGRAAEIDRLRAHVAALGRRGRAVTVVGEQGIGKSRLVAELLDGLEPTDLGLAGRASEFERDVPFAPFVDALDPYLGSLGERRLRALNPEQRARLAAIFPALPRSDDEPKPRGERYRSHHAARALLEQMAAGRRCVLFLDDAHWADEASVELIAHLLRRPPVARLLLVLAVRPGQAGPRLRAALDGAVREGACETIELRPLSRDDAAPLLVGVDDADGVYRESGGNPFFLEQLAGAAAQGDAVPRDGQGADDVPPAVRGALVAELAELAPPARALLDAAAVAGDPFEAALAARIAGLPKPRALHAVDDLAAQELVRVTDVPGG
jgi:predicted ATPase